MKHLWIVAIALEAVCHWYIIEKAKQGIDHWLVVLPRLAVGIMFFLLIVYEGSYWYWTAPYLFFSHILLFPELLNIFRGKYVGYLDTPEDKVEDSKWDIFFKNKVGEFPWLWIRVILALAFIGIFFTMGDQSWAELQR